MSYSVSEISNMLDTLSDLLSFSFQQKITVGDKEYFGNNRYEKTDVIGGEILCRVDYGDKWENPASVLNPLFKDDIISLYEDADIASLPGMMSNSDLKMSLGMMLNMMESGTSIYLGGWNQNDKNLFQYSPSNILQEGYPIPGVILPSNFDFTNYGDALDTYWDEITPTMPNPFTGLSDVLNGTGLVLDFDPTAISFSTVFENVNLTKIYDFYLEYVTGLAGISVSMVNSVGFSDYSGGFSFDMNYDSSRVLSSLDIAVDGILDWNNNILDYLYLPVGYDYNSGYLGNYTEDYDMIYVGMGNGEYIYDSYYDWYDYVEYPNGDYSYSEIYTYVGTGRGEYVNIIPLPDIYDYNDFDYVGENFTYVGEGNGEYIWDDYWGEFEYIGGDYNYTFVGDGNGHYIWDEDDEEYDYAGFDYDYTNMGPNGGPYIYDIYDDYYEDYVFIGYEFTNVGSGNGDYKVDTYEDITSPYRYYYVGPNNGNYAKTSTLAGDYIRSGSPHYQGNFSIVPNSYHLLGNYSHAVQYLGSYDIFINETAGTVEYIYVGEGNGTYEKLDLPPEIDLTNCQLDLQASISIERITDLSVDEEEEKGIPGYPIAIISLLSVISIISLIKNRKQK
jgi:hypothetical protein